MANFCLPAAVKFGPTLHQQQYLHHPEPHSCLQMRSSCAGYNSLRLDESTLANCDEVRRHLFFAGQPTQRLRRKMLSKAMVPSARWGNSVGGDEEGWTVFKYTKPEEASTKEVVGKSRIEVPAGNSADVQGNQTGIRGLASMYKTEVDRLVTRLKSFGMSGVLSYGIFNTAYYLGTFLYVWFRVAPSPGGLGYSEAAKRFIKIFAMVWAGSQVTKLLRLGCALVLAPAVDKGLDMAKAHHNFKSKGQVFGVVVATCAALAVVVFVAITCAWA